MRRFLLPIVLLIAGCSDAKRSEQALSQVNSLAHRLGGQTTATGLFVRPGEGSEFEFKEVLDPWGHPLKAEYTRGGFLETLVVRSAGADGQYANSDDIVAETSRANLIGIASGVKENVGGVVEDGARGFTTGIIKGVKDQFSTSTERDQDAKNPPAK